MSNLVVKNWNPQGRYDFGVGMGYYFSGQRTKFKDGKTITSPHDPSKQIKLYEDLLAQIVEASEVEGEGSPILIVDDASPVKMSPDRTMDIVGKHPLAYVHLPRNIGTGGKENILQKVLSKRCKYVMRYDCDIKLDNIDFAEVRNGFEEFDDAWAITACITYFARHHASSLPEDQRYFSGSNIADFVAMRSSAFKRIGFSDPVLRRNNDGDLRLRALAALGMKCYVDRTITGKAPPSGSGNTLDRAIRVAKYVEATRPFIMVQYPSGKQPRFMLNKKKKVLGRGFYVPSIEFADDLARAVWS